MIMALVEEIEKIVNEQVDKRMNELSNEIFFLKPWLTMGPIKEILDKNSRWIIDNLCTKEFENKGLVKKVGGQWHFKNPEFVKYIHDVWWKEV
ncbi:hypothetical protein C7H83_10280 [Tetragenococcus halophilus]|uniref:DUF771 domain-containing protein n=2 Tax=Tetragenococcus halophilus TaxID=51669 RepID=A0A3G5FL15_TETHA|nr:hypothetical protein [Tetragenococcus halophilus]AYW50828.1 hypothetical protein C7H83_10280 [Tetragenococcus halophilus]GMA08896.1 hypothetical protein GCM10025886_20470 [Tetragenococcus halophilus subsp. flandriensis]